MNGHRRLKTSLLAIGCAVALAAVPANATPSENGEDHTVTLCHVTNSAKNPWVQITVDIAAFDGEGANDHTHHVSKDGREDYILEDGATCSENPED